MKEIFDRVKQIIISPKETWQIIKGENPSIQELFINYAAPLALIPAVAALIGITIIGVRMPSGSIVRAPFMEALTSELVGFIFQLLGILFAGWIVTLLAPYFNSRSDFNTATKLVVYSMTPIWLVGVLSLIPSLGILEILGLYGVYLLYLGLPVLLDTPKERAIWYTTLIIITAFIIQFILTAAVYGPMLLRMMAV